MSIIPAIRTTPENIIIITYEVRNEAIFSLSFMITIQQYKDVDNHSHYLKKQLAVGYGMMTTERRLHREHERNLRF